MSNMSCFSFHMILDSEKYRLLVTCMRALSKRSVKTITSGVMIIVDVQRLDNAFYRINVNKTNHAICWIVIYSCSGGYKNNSLHLARKFARIFVLGHYLFRVPNIFLRASGSRKTVSYEEQIMSKDKYPSVFSPQMEVIVFIILQIFYATRAVLKIVNI